tara:strand:+ start:5460 stop:7136 length:1677 start_codon:yes stop_codon:yes gene_type:complete
MEKLYSKKTTLILVLFIVFISLRLFVPNDTILLGSDHIKYIESAKNFPYHTLYNQELYLLHPPLYPYLIHTLNLIIPQEHLASITLSFLSAILLFFTLYKFFMLITKNFNITFIILIFVTLSIPFIQMANSPLRESFLLLLMFSSLYYFIRGIKFGEKFAILLSALFGIMLAFTSDHVVFLIPAIGITYIFLNKEKIELLKFKLPNLIPLIILIILITGSYGVWSYIKFNQYSKTNNYPNGYEGVPVNTEDLGILQTISPQNFNDYGGTFIKSGPISIIKKLAFNFGYMYNIEPIPIPLGLNFTTIKFLLKPKHVAFMIIFYLPLAILSILTIGLVFFNFLKNKNIHNNINIYFISLFLLYLFPITQKFSSPRYIFTAYIFLFYFVSLGINKLISKLTQLELRKTIFPIISLILLLLIPIWHNSNPNLIFNSEVITGASNTANFIKTNISNDAGFMVQPGYNAKLIYLTGNRMVGLHHDPKRLLPLIEQFEIEYLIFGRHFTWEVAQLSKNSVEFILSRSDLFEHVATIQEDYSEFFTEEDSARFDEVYIYKIRKNYS